MLIQKTDASKVVALVLVAAMAFMLFSRPLYVSAADYNIVLVSSAGTSQFVPVEKSIYFNPDLDVEYYGDTVTYTAREGSVLDIDINFTGIKTVSYNYPEYLCYDMIYYNFKAYASYKLDFVCGLRGSFTFNYFVTSATFYVYVNGERYEFVNGTDAYLKYNDYPADTRLEAGLHLQISYQFSATLDRSTSLGLASGYSAYANLTVTPQMGDFNIYGVTSLSSDAQAIVDAIKGEEQKQTEIAQGQLEESKKQTEIAEGQLEESKKQTEIAEEQAETSKGILSSITDFFGSFFDNLIEMIKHLFIPSSDELMEFLDEVNEWFGDRLGFIWYPFDLAIDMVAAFAFGEASSTFTVPSFSLNILGDSYVIWQPFEVDLDAFGIFVYVRYFTSVMVVGATVKLASDKWSAWIGGRNGS